MAGATWNCCHLGTSSVYTIQPCTISLHAKPNTYGVCVFSCNLPPALLAERPGSFMGYCGNTGVEGIPKITVSTESWPWRRKFSRRSCRDSNPRPFNHESGALTTDLSRSPFAWHHWQNSFPFTCVTSLTEPSPFTCVTSFPFTCMTSLTELSPVYLYDATDITVPHFTDVASYDYLPEFQYAEQPHVERM